MTQRLKERLKTWENETKTKYVRLSQRGERNARESVSKQKGAGTELESAKKQIEKFRQTVFKTFEKPKQCLCEIKWKTSTQTNLPDGEGNEDSREQYDATSKL